MSAGSEPVSVTLCERGRENLLSLKAGSLSPLLFNKTKREGEKGGGREGGSERGGAKLGNIGNSPQKMDS